MKSSSNKINPVNLITILVLVAFFLRYPAKTLIVAALIAGAYTLITRILGYISYRAIRKVYSNKKKCNVTFRE